MWTLPYIHNNFVKTVSFFQICVEILACSFVLQMPDTLIIVSIVKKKLYTL